MYRFMKFRFYRAIKVWAGYRSFTKINEDGNNTYLMIKGKSFPEGEIRRYIELGFTEEWPEPQVKNG